MIAIIFDNVTRCSLKIIAMRKLMFLFVLLAIVLFSCKQNKYATSGGKYESDDVYYQPSDKYISDFALVDDEARMDQSTLSRSTEGDSTTTLYQDDYYSGNTDSTNDNAVNNYYGPVYESPWNYGGFGNNGGFGNYGYGSFSCWPMSNFSIGWNPWTGWYTGFNFGYNWGYSCYNSGWNNGWYSPFYTPGCFNQWGYNTWYSPFNYNNPYYGFNNPYYGGNYNGGFWSNGDVYANTMYGHRNPLATATAVNSTYGHDVFYSGRTDKPMFANDPAISSVTSRPSKLDPPALQIAETKPINNSEKPSPSVQPVVSGSKPSYSQLSDDRIESLRPDPSEQSSVFKPQSQTSQRPRPTYTPESVRTDINQTPTVRPSRVEGKPTNYQKPAYTSPNNNPSRHNPAPVYNNSRSNTSPASVQPQYQTQPQRQQPSVPQQKPTVKPDKGSPSKVPQGNSKGGEFNSPPSGGNRGGAPSGGGSKAGGGGSISGPRRK